MSKVCLEVTPDTVYLSIENRQAVEKYIYKRQGNGLWVQLKNNKNNKLQKRCVLILTKSSEIQIQQQ